MISMAPRRTIPETLKTLGRTSVSACLCGILAGQPLFAQSALPRPAAKPDAPLTQQERILQALNRFTFGPRPGDVEAVQAMGLHAWFEYQLDPSTINDSALEARLAAYPAMNLPTPELVAEYPGPQQIRQMVNGNLSLPHDPTLKLFAQDQIALYKIQKQNKEAKAPAAPEAAMPQSSMQQSSMQQNSMQPADGQQNEPRINSKSVSAGFTALDDAAGKDTASPADRAARRALIVQMSTLPPDQRFLAILKLPPDQLFQFRQALRGQEQLQITEGMTPQQSEMLGALGGSQRMIGLEEQESRLERDIYSNRQLEAVMTDFWLNHFNVYLRKNQQEPYLIPAFERDAIRKNALGNFESLLDATATSPAMMEYLDNARSEGPDSPAAERAKSRAFLRPNAKAAQDAGLNENYGRELMELHTLGVNGGYTQADVTSVAKVLTGWTVVPLNKPGGGTFVFDDSRHEPGSKVVLGQKINENDYHEGLQVLHMLATSPATAHFISQQLAVRFVSDNPPPALVDRMAAAFLASHGDIKTVLRTLWNSPEFWSSSAYRAKVKTPEEFVISAVRASGAQVTQPAALVQAVARLGMPFYGMQTPNGYSWKEDDWVSTGALVSRMNFALVLSGDRIPGVRTDWNAEVGSPAHAGMLPAGYSPDTSSEVKLKEQRLELALIGQPVSDRTRAAVLGQANDASVTEQAATQFDLNGGGRKAAYKARPAVAGAPPAALDDPQAAVMAGLLLGSPEFQRR
jgi:uncharacterized protein (DUF1800 family)